MNIHQLIAGFSKHDAISNEALFFQKMLRSWGYTSNIYAPLNHIHPALKNKAMDCRTLQVSTGDILIYHFSMGSETSELFETVNCKKILRYHNITPDHFFKNINRDKMIAAKKGREELVRLNHIPDYCLADSEYNKTELNDHHFKNIHVLPLNVNSDLLRIKPNPKILNQYNDTATNFLFVGRMVPNKKFEDIIQTFYFYHKTINANSRLFLIGSYIDLENYANYLKLMVDRLDLSNVIFTGDIPQEDLNAYYQLSHIFLCMSEHEGFCVPLLEAMYFNLPIIAFNKTGIPYTLKDSGILLHKKNYKYVAELIHILLQQDTIKEKLLQNQQTRLKNFSEEKIAKQFNDFLSTI